MDAMNLNNNWTVCEADGRSGEPKGAPVPARVPGDIHADLSRAGRLPEDLFYRENLKQARWVENRNWVYESTFTLRRLPPAKAGAELVFDGLDTFCDVFLNEVKIGSSENMFRQYRFDVRDNLKRGKNILRVLVRSSRKETQRLHKKHPEYQAIFMPGRSLVRRAQCQFGWDWAPDAVSLGIWRDVRLEFLEDCSIDSVYVEAQTNGHCCVRTALRSQVYDGEIDVQILDGKRCVAKTVLSANGANNFAALKIPRPKLWWPNGMGTPHGYTCRVQIRDTEGAVRDEKTVFFGLRSVEIEEHVVEDDRMGFTFKINGERVFIKGANWVPPSCFPGEVTPDHYRRLVRRAQEANYNMLRIWGGGIYEHDAFYEECNRRGIMVWQDFANACSEPPDDRMDFLNNILTEAEYQVKRLRNHPAVVCWCGGNESSSSHRYEPHRPGRRLAHWYYRGVVGDFSPATPYIFSSPHGKSDFGQIQTSGETHWSTWPRSAEVSYDSYRERLKDIRTVFNGEICLQGPSPMESQLRFLDPEDLWPPNKTVDYHVMRHPCAMDVHPRFVVSQIKMAEQIIGPCDSAESFVNNGMMAHAEMVREELGFYRSAKWKSSGAMNWMFNECWPCSNWALVDYYGALKPAYYMQKKMFAPLAVTIKKVHHDFTLHLMNDMLTDVSGTVRTVCMDISGKIYWEESFDGNCPANSCVVAKRIAPSRVKGANVFLRMEWTVGNQIFSENYFPQLFKDVEFEKPKLTPRIGKAEKTAGGYKTRIRIAAENYARFVYVDLPLKKLRSMTLSDNYFDLIPGETKTVTLTSTVPPGKIAVRSLLI